MEIFAFTQNAVGYEDQGPEPQLRAFDELSLDISKSAFLGLAGAAVAVGVAGTAPDAQAVVNPGDRCAAVGDLQRALNNWGFSAGPVDNQFGAQTEAAVRDFQRFQGLPVDGIVGPQTAEPLGLAVPGSAFEMGQGCGSSGEDGASQERSVTVAPASGVNIRSAPNGSRVGGVAQGAVLFFDPASSTSNGGFTWVRITQGPFAGQWFSLTTAQASGGDDGGGGSNRSGIVSTGSGGGLRARSGPSQGAGVSGSFAEGATVFFDPNSATAAGGLTWVRVTSGDLANSWVARDFLR